MGDGFPSGSMRVGLAISLMLALLPVAGMILGLGDDSMTWRGVAFSSLWVALVAVVIGVVLPWLWRNVRRHATTGAAHAREHQAGDGRGYGRVYPSGPGPDEPARDSGAEAPLPSEAPPLVLRRWFGLEGWQQASIIGALVGVLVALGVYRATDEGGFQRADLLPMFWVWAISLWFALAVWTGAYMRRAYPNLRSITYNPRHNPAGCVGFFAVFEIYPQAVWFLITLMLSAATAPLRLLGRRLRR